MKEGFQICHDLDAPCTEQEWACCSPHSENTDSLKKCICVREKELPHLRNIFLSFYIVYNTYLLEAIVLVTIGAIPAVPVPIGHNCVLITEPAVNTCMGGLLSASNKVNPACYSVATAAVQLCKNT